MTAVRQTSSEIPEEPRDSPVDSAADEARYPIRVVCRRTGIKPATLRAWEKRYAAVSPHRTATDRRLYSEADIRRLSLLQRAIGSGWQIGQIAGLPDPEVAALLESPAPPLQEAAEPAPASPRESSPVRPELEPFLEAIWALDSATLRQRLEEALLVETRQRVVETIVAPLLHTVGEAWAEGRLRPVHEHLATSTVRAFLSSLSSQYNGGNGDHRVIVTTPSGQLHEIGALIAAAVAEDAGWAVTYLGPNLPAEEIALAARQRDATAVVLSIVLCTERAQLEASLHTLRRLLPRSVAIIAGGRATPVVAEALEQIGAQVPADLAGFRALLAEYRALDG